jgi:hypothetical protein
MYDIAFFTIYLRDVCNTVLLDAKSERETARLFLTTFEGKAEYGLSGLAEELLGVDIWELCRDRSRYTVLP